MALRRCSKCRQMKEEEEFAWKLNILGIRHSACNECRKSYPSEYYQRTKGDRAAYKANRQIEAREIASDYDYTHLKALSCIDCGEIDPLVLTFDHVKGNKRMNISQMVNLGYSIEAIQAEMDKCVSRCANCHMKHEKKKRGTRYWIF